MKMKSRKYADILLDGQTVPSKEQRATNTNKRNDYNHKNLLKCETFGLFSSLQKPARIFSILVLFFWFSCLGFSLVLFIQFFGITNFFGPLPSPPPMYPTFLTFAVKYSSFVFKHFFFRFVWLFLFDIFPTIPSLHHNNNTTSRKGGERREGGDGDDEENPKKTRMIVLFKLSIDGKHNTEISIKKYYRREVDEPANRRTDRQSYTQRKIYGHLTCDTECC